MLNQEIARLLGTEWSGMRTTEQVLRLDYCNNEANATVMLRFDEQFENYTIEQFIDNNVVYSRDNNNDFEAYYRGLYMLVSGDKYVQDFIKWLKAMPND